MKNLHHLKHAERNTFDDIQEESFVVNSFPGDATFSQNSFVGVLIKEKSRSGERDPY